MALKKTITKPNGIQTEYHKIQNMKVGSKITIKEEVDGSMQEEQVYIVSITLVSYVSEELRQKNNALFVEEANYSFHILASDFEAKPPHELVYAELKKLDKFADAEDC